MIATIAVLGAGTMGQSIARVFAEKDYPVSLFEPNITLHTALEQHLVDNLPSLQLYAQLDKAVENADLIIECAPENLLLKQALFEQLTQLMKSTAIVASNTSTFSLQQLAAEVSYTDRFIITHFFNPAHLIPLVEIIGLSSTAPELVEQVVQLLQAAGKSPVVLNKDIPGFIANRLQAALMREACYLLDSGVADVQQIDTVVKESIGMRWALKGPFEIADLGGLDIWSKVTGHLFPELNNSTDIPASLQEHVAHEQLGIKSSKGYYEYEQTTHQLESWNDSLLQLLRMKQSEKEGNEHDA